MSVDTPALPTTDFSGLGLKPALVRALQRQGITAPTPVQAAVIPDALAGRDVLARARTGSGKTLAFGLPMAARLTAGRTHPRSPRGLVIVPTRELATQVRRAIEPVADAARLRLVTVYGGTSYETQIRGLRAGADIVVATPGRLDDLIRRGACRLDAVEVAVLDEADHLCDLGFFPAVNALLRQTPSGGQRLLLSATLDGDVDRLVRSHLTRPVRHEVDPVEGGDSTLSHHVLVVGQAAKRQATAALVTANPRSIVFTRTRHGASALAKQLRTAGVGAVDLHGSLTQRARERNLQKFTSGAASVVVATDIAARGIHVDEVGLVVHYDAPAQAKAYLHRSGRTGRAGHSGAVVTVTTPETVDVVVRLQRAAGVAARHHDIATVTQPMTAATLAASGKAAPELIAGPRAGQGRRPSRQASRNRRRRHQGSAGR